VLNPEDKPDELLRDNPVWLAWRSKDFEWWSMNGKPNFDFEWHYCRHAADGGDGRPCTRVMLAVTARHDEEELFDCGLTFKHGRRTIRGIPTSDQELELDLRQTFRGRHLMHF